MLKQYKVYQRINNVPVSGPIRPESWSFKQAIEYCSPRVFQGNHLIEFEIRPVNSPVLDEMFLPDVKDSFYLRKENNKPVILRYYHTDKWKQLNCREIDFYSTEEEKEEKKQNLYVEYLDTGGHCGIPLTFEASLENAENILKDKINYPNVKLVEIRPVPNPGPVTYSYNNKNSYYLSFEDEENRFHLTFYNGVRHEIAGMETEKIYHINEDILPPIEKINKNNPVELNLLLQKKDIMDLLLLLNFIRPVEGNGAKYFKTDLINNIKGQIGDFLIENEEI